MERETNPGLWPRLRDLIGLTRPAQEDPALERAYARFHAAYPEWTASLFDWHFITHHVLPIIAESPQGFSKANAARIARAWAGHWNLGDDFQNRSTGRAMSAAWGFLTFLQAEIARQAKECFADSTWQNARQAPFRHHLLGLERCAGGPTPRPDRDRTNHPI